jgi:hypothetical protein
MFRRPKRKKERTRKYINVNESKVKVCPAIKNCPSARCASAAIVVCRDFDMFRRQNISLDHILL